MSEYTYDQISQSFNSVLAFLKSKNYNSTNYNKIECKFSFKNPEHSYIHTLETECKQFIENPSFVLHSDSFKSEGFHKPVWSSFNLFSWDDKKEELSVELNGKEFILKHI